MKLKNKKIIIAVGIIVASILLLAIGSVIGRNLYFGGSYSERSYMDTNYEYSDAAGDAVSETDQKLFSQAEEGQKLVYSGNVTIGTDNIKKSYKAIAESMEKNGASFESVSESSYSKTMVIRVPQKNFMDMYESLSEVSGTITSSNINIMDKTKSYTDNERRIGILQAEYDELKELMSKAQSVEEILSIKDRMLEVTYELEGLKGANDTIDYDANFARLEVSLQLNSSRDPLSFGHQIKEALGDSITAIKGVVLFLVRIWWILTLGIGAYLLLRRRRKSAENPEQIE